MRRAEFNDLQDGKGEQVRRFLRHIQESVRRLDELVHRATQPTELFTPDAVVWRYRLRELCEKLLFLDFRNHGRKAEDLLWRKGFYDAFNAAKQMKKGELWSKLEESILENHLLAGLGGYQHIIHRLQSDSQIDLPSSIDCTFIQRDGGLRKAKTILSSKNCEQPEGVWARECLQRCLIYMGDLTRYRKELNPDLSDLGNLARRYYQQAIRINPDVGMPHNQLGTLAGNSRHGVDTVYHYMRCIMCSQSFDGAEGNLRRVLERNRKLYEERRRSGAPDIYAQLLSSYLMVVEVFFFEDGTPYSGPEMCQQTLVELGRYSELCDKPDPDGVPERFEPDMATRLLAIILLCVYRLQQTNSNQVSIAIAFTLALLSHLVYQTAAGLHSVLNHFGLKANVDEKLPNGHLESKTKKKNHRLRRRKCIYSDRETDSSGDEDASGNEHTDSSDLSGSDDTSSLDSDEDESITVDTNKNITKENGRVRSSSSTSDQLNIISEDALLPAIKVACDWLRGDSELIRSSIPSSRPLWSHMVHLFNVLSVDSAAILKENIHPILSKGLNCQGSEFKASIPLSEDVEVRCLPPLKPAHTDLDWNSSVRFTRRDETLMRILSIKSFGHFLTTIHDCGVGYDKNVSQFTQNQSPNGIVNETAAAPEEREDREALMQQMAALWLREEVRDLEQTVGGGGKIKGKLGGPQLSPYLVPDSPAFIHYMPLLRQLIDSRRFILVVPDTVVDELDEGKKTMAGAREAIRWLEGQFRRGSRYVRPQRGRERTHVPTLKYPKKKKKEEINFFHILECCYYLVQRSTAQGMVTLLTGDRGRAEQQHAALANTTGIAFEHVEVFHSKWKTSTKSRG